jgi:hypothetical protein
MWRHSLDDSTADRLLAGTLDSEDVPPGYAGVAELLRTARGPTATDELGQSDAVVSAMAAAVGVASGAMAHPTSKGKKMRGKLLSLKVIGIAIPAMALTATGAAAATSNLPAPAQSAIHGALAHVGVSIPNGNDSSNTGKGKGPDATGPAKHGLCTAFAGHANSHSVAYANLQKAASTAGQSVTQFCSGVAPGNGGSDDTGSSGSSESTAPDSPKSSGGGNRHTPAGPPTSTPGSDHTNTSTPMGPPNSTPAPTTTPVSTPAGPPASTPGEKPASTPGGKPASTPGGKPASTPGGKP